MKQSKLCGPVLILFILFIIFSSVRAQFEGENCTLVGRWGGGRCFAVAVDGNIAYFGNGSYLEIVDFTDPSNPVELSRVLLPSVVGGVTVKGDYGYVCNAEYGLHGGVGDSIYLLSIIEWGYSFINPHKNFNFFLPYYNLFIIL